MKQAVLQRRVVSRGFLVLQNRERYALETSSNSAPFHLNHHISAEICFSRESGGLRLPRWLTSAGAYPALSSPSLLGLWETCSESEEVPRCHTGSSCNPIAEVRQCTPLQGAFIFQKWSLFPVALGKHMSPNQYMVSIPYFLYYRASLGWFLAQSHKTT